MSGEFPDPTYIGTIHFITSDSGDRVVLPEDYTFTVRTGMRAARTFDVTLVTAGPQTVTATDTDDAAITGDGDTTVDAGPADTIDMSGTDRGPHLRLDEAMSRPWSRTLSAIPSSGSRFRSAKPWEAVRSVLRERADDRSGVATDTVTGAGAGAVTVTGTTATPAARQSASWSSPVRPSTLDLTGAVQPGLGRRRILTATVKDAALQRDVPATSVTSRSPGAAPSPG